MFTVCHNRDSESLFCIDKSSWNILIRGLGVVLSGDPGAESGRKGKSKRAGKNGAKKSKATICPWVSEDGSVVEGRTPLWLAESFSFSQ